MDGKIDSEQEMTEEERKELEANAWTNVARESQREPRGTWRVWLILAGRGFGKTRTGAETLREWVLSGRARRIALVGQTIGEVRDVMVEGESGLINVSWPESKIKYSSTRRSVVWPNGATATAYSAANYEQLRGPQFDCAWIDELAKFRDPEAVWHQLLLSVRIGNPRFIITTTPRPIPLLRHLIAREGRDVHLTRGTTFENSENLAPTFIDSIEQQFAGTRLGPQELFGEMLSATEGALWTFELLSRRRVLEAPPLKRIVVAVDPSVTHSESSDETGIIVAGICDKNSAYVIEDLSGVYPTTTWARVAIEAYHRHRADRIVAEVNQGGDLVESLMRSIDETVSYQGVHASRGKYARAEPVCALYEQTRAFHVGGGFKKLEEQMCAYVPGVSKKSPDRMDALVWALTALLLGERKDPVQPRIWKV